MRLLKYIMKGGDMMVDSKNLTWKEKEILHRFQQEKHPELQLRRLSFSDEDMEYLNSWYRLILKLYFLEVYGFKVTVI